MDHRHLQLLIALDEHRNLARVSERFNVTPPAISKSLREIEEELDAQLFDRGPRGVAPTVLGACMIRHARTVIAELANASTELRALKSGLLGNVSLGVLPAAAPLLAPLGIARLKERAPFVTVLLREGTIDAVLPDLHVGKLDIMVGTIPWSHLASGLAIELLYDDETMVVVARIGHPLARHRSVRLGQLLDYPWIIPPAGTSVGESFRQLMVRRRIEVPRNRVESGSIVANKNSHSTDRRGRVFHQADRGTLCRAEGGRRIGREACAGCGRRRHDVGQGSPAIPERAADANIVAGSGRAHEEIAGV